ncbi:TetR family transcriptional regulator [Mycolicibacterium phlei]|jgi:AcrR family transcriptional regulator|uniref:Tetracycline repressor n=1 Tax=Mycolicibacterium phlei DSM 43239 = CCUG 21000 TaxID=1226750 RepID=A0A5N5VCZ1_MYCPH|nr:Tetracycline repressor protein class E [Mycolicibacterium phlei]KAB7759626.1 tetracycline repressor [Mycolicibacterium phlei DSM 43239 = CCUG 21000]KXW60252.1 tetracycline repressor [Mycolicibacterium phlei DSM 43072]KXW66217.1 tetracycline repressor [Mycolicibacterium phlei DSM 43070]VEG11627.1 TetR family transcriptional regulator [Mycobacteroides chelonae]
MAKLGRPRTPLLSTERITKAALDLVCSAGDFTMPGIAQKLKVRPSSLYNHVRGRDEVVELLREHAMSGVALPPDDPDRPWRDVVADIMRAYRHGFARYPRLIPLLTLHAVNSTQAFRMYNALAVTLKRAGFDPADTMRVISLIDSFVLGAALDVAAPDEPWKPGTHVGPELAEALAAGATRPDRADDAFEYGLAVLLRGLPN